MDVPQIGALPGVPSAAAGMPSGFTQLATALSGLPQGIDEANVKHLQNEQQRQELGKQLLATYAQRVQQDPSAGQNPQFVHQLDQITGQSGLPAVTQRLGSGPETANRDALIPRRHVSELDDKTRLDMLGRPPAQRKAYADALGIDTQDPASQSFFTMPEDVSLNPAIVSAAHSGAERALIGWQAGTIAPEAYAQFIKANSRALGDDYVRQMTDPSFVASGISRMADAKIAAIPAEIAVKGDLGALRGRIESDAMERFNKTFGLKRDEDSEKNNLRRDQLSERRRVDDATITRDAASARNMDAQAQRARAAAGDSSRLLGARLQLLGAQIERTNLTNRSTTAALAEKTEKDLINAQKNLTTLNNNIATQIFSNRGDTEDPQMKAMMDERTQLQATIDAARGVVDKGKAAGQNAAGATVQAVTGNTAQSTGGGVQRSTSKSGKAIFSTDGGATWSYGNGP